MPLIEINIPTDSFALSDTITRSAFFERFESDALSSISDIATQSLIRTVSIKNIRALTSTKVRIDFTASVVIDEELIDVNNYTFSTVSASAVDVIPQSINLPPGQLYPSFVEVIVTEHTNSAIYSVQLSNNISGRNGEVSGGLSQQYSGIGDAPTILLVLATDETHANVYFSENIVNNSAANNSLNYVWDGGLQTLSVDGVSGNIVTLKTSIQTPDFLYHLTLKGLLSISLNDYVVFGDSEIIDFMS